MAENALITLSGTKSLSRLPGVEQVAIKPEDTNKTHSTQSDCEAHGSKVSAGFSACFFTVCPVGPL